MSHGRRRLRLLVFTAIMGVLISSVGIAKSAGVPFKMVQVEEVASGSGSAGSGTLAVASIFLPSASNGGGGFSGTIGGLPVSGLFNLTAANPASTPNLSCATSGGQVSAAGTVISGSFLGHQVVVAGCVDMMGKVVLVLIDVTPWHCIECAPDFTGKGMGIVTLSNMSPKAGVAMAGATSGSGSAGPNTLYVAEVDAIARDNSILGGGAMVDRAGSGNTWVINRASLDTSCNLITSGTTSSFGLFPGQPVSSSYTLTTCPPTSVGPQTTRFVYAVGGDLAPLYKGAGSAIFNPLILNPLIL